MLIPFSTPVTRTDTGITINGFTLLTTLAGLKDGRPGRQTRIAWPAGAQTIDTIATIQLAWTQPVEPRVAAIAAISGLPEGLRCTIGWAMSDGGAPTEHLQESPITRNTSGDLIVYDHWPAGLGQAWGVQFTFFNDVGGVVSVAAEQAVDIGEVWASGALEVAAKGEVGRSPAAGTVTELSASGQPYDAIALPRRRLSVPANWEIVGKALQQDQSVEEVQQLLALNPRTFITQFEEPKALARRTAMYAKLVQASQSGIARGARRQRSDWEFEELRAS